MSDYIQSCGKAIIGGMIDFIPCGEKMNGGMIDFQSCGEAMASGMEARNLSGGYFVLPCGKENTSGMADLGLTWHGFCVYGALCGSDYPQLKTKNLNAYEVHRRTSADPA